jgi:hypothetical protein
MNSFIYYHNYFNNKNYKKKILKFKLNYWILKNTHYKVNIIDENNIINTWF